MKTCHSCGHEVQGGKRQCEHCHAYLGTLCPNPDEIAAICREIQATWTPAMERHRRGDEEDAIEIPMARRVSTGQRGIALRLI